MAYSHTTTEDGPKTCSPPEWLPLAEALQCADTTSKAALKFTLAPPFEIRQVSRDASIDIHSMQGPCTIMALMFWNGVAHNPRVTALEGEGVSWRVHLNMEEARMPPSEADGRIGSALLSLPQTIVVQQDSTCITPPRLSFSVQGSVRAPLVWAAWPHGRPFLSRSLQDLPLIPSSEASHMRRGIQAAQRLLAMLRRMRPQPSLLAAREAMRAAPACGAVCPVVVPLAPLDVCTVQSASTHTRMIRVVLPMPHVAPIVRSLRLCTPPSGRPAHEALFPDAVTLCVSDVPLVPFVRSPETQGTWACPTFVNDCPLVMCLIDSPVTVILEFVPTKEEKEDEGSWRSYVAQLHFEACLPTAAECQEILGGERHGLLCLPVHHPPAQQLAWDEEYESQDPANDQDHRVFMVHLAGKCGLKRFDGKETAVAHGSV
jgi:hypothetical protein